ncbi:MAG: hypothetical protein ACRCVJ_00010 [Clostridium sp.]|uniref:hypothetical protein n=1 Tax=Clostridium sp. TaxID=1506 RepID=UPI003F2A119C
METPIKKTKLEEVYSRFLPKITCYEYLKPTFTKEMLEMTLDGYIQSVLAKYVVDRTLKIDFTERYFNRELEGLEIEILVYGLIVEWIAPSMNNMQWLKQNLKSKEYNTISEANQLRAIEGLYRQSERDFQYWQTRYSYIKQSEGAN